MLTKAQAIRAAERGLTIHYTGQHSCSRVVGPRGGVKDTITAVRPSGQCKTWKTRPADFRLPVKYGMYESNAITQDNAADWHLDEDCPVYVVPTRMTNGL